MGEHEAWNGNGESSTSMPSLSGLERLDEIARMSRLKQHWTDQVKQFSREDLEGELIDRGLPDAQLREMADASEEILRREVVAARLREAFPPFKKGRPAVWKSAIEVRGPLHIEHDGWAEHGRRLAALLNRRFVTRVSLTAVEEAPEQLRTMLERSCSSIWLQVLHLIPERNSFANIANRQREWATDEQLKAINARRVVSTTFERWPLSDDDVEALRSVGEVWVPCTMNKRVLVESGLEAERVRVVPIPRQDHDPYALLEDWRERRRARVLAGSPVPVRFYHVGKWEPRKAQAKIVFAFLLAFKAGDPVELRIKTKPMSTRVEDYPMDAAEAVRMALTSPGVLANGWTAESVSNQVKVWNQSLSEEAMLNFHKVADVYVSLAHGEGFCMPAHDAKACGNRLLYVPSGGVEDFADEGDVVVPVTGHERAFNAMYAWPPSSNWHSFRIQDAVSGFREAYRRTIAREPTGRLNLERAMVDETLFLEAVSKAFATPHAPSPEWPRGRPSNEYERPYSTREDSDTPEGLATNDLSKKWPCELPLANRAEVLLKEDQ